MALTNRLLLLLLFYSLFHIVATTNYSRITDSADDNYSWLNSNFPIHPTEDNNAIIIAANLSEQCLQDTRLQLASLRGELPWAVESKLITNKFNYIIDLYIFQFF